jgi:hypothetical protein
MGFNKKYITKDIILATIKEGGDVKKLLKADALIMDNWSSIFFDNYDTSKKYEENRDKLNKDVIFISSLDNIIEHENFPKLRKLSNILENLIKNPSWTEVLLACSFNISGTIPESHQGKFDLHVKFHTDSIIEFYTSESRNKN